MSDWKKCPSVTPGGKPFFYKKDNLTVIWDRMAGSWCLENPLMVIDRFTSADEAMERGDSVIEYNKEAMKAADRMNKKGEN